MLVVLHQHLVDACRQLAGEAGDLALHVGVVGFHMVTADQQPVTKQGGGDQRDDDQEQGQTTLQLRGHGEIRTAWTGSAI